MYYLLKHFCKNVFYASPLLRVFYKLWKYVKAIATSSSELYRICHDDLARQRRLHGTHSSVDTTADIERSLMYSTQLTLERRSIESRECGLDQVIQMILLKKRFPGNGVVQNPEAIILSTAISRIHESYKLVYELNSRAATKFDSTNKHQDRKLMELWDMLMPNQKLEGRLSKQWQDIGFQGKDPSTDFRGMGMLGLDDLHYFAKHHHTVAQRVLQCSHHPVSWYSFAIVGINITAFALQTIRTRRLQYYLFTHEPQKQVYHEFYCYLFNAFNDYWISYRGTPPLTVMDFERQFGKFKAIVEQDLIIRKNGMRLSTELKSL